MGGDPEITGSLFGMLTADGYGVDRVSGMIKKFKTGYFYKSSMLI